MAPPQPPPKKKARSLADEIADLTNPAPRFTGKDPESHDFGAELDHYNDDSDSPEQLGVQRQGKKGPARLPFRGDLAMDGNEYAGKKGSRKRSLGSDEDEMESDDGDDDDDGGGEPNGFGESDASEEDEDEGQSDEDEPRWAPAAVNDEARALDKEYERLRREEENILKGVKQQGAGDEEKGRAIANQRFLWDRMLELRIALHKILSSSHRLPREDTRPLFLKEGRGTEMAYKKVTTSALDTLSVLSDLQTALLDRNSAIPPAAKSPPTEEADGDGKADDAVARSWERIEQQFARLAPFRDNAVDRWHRKTLLSSGAAAVRGRLQALNQSVTVQVSSAMREPSRSLLISRSRAKRSDLQVLGQKAVEREGDGVHESNPAPSPDALPEELEVMDRRREAEDVDAETFDDTEFYQQLLREFLETADPNARGGMNTLRKLKNKKRKVVDRRASKGRKIRYSVHPQLVNFMAPVARELPPVAAKLLATLFGQRNGTLENGR